MNARDALEKYIYQPLKSYIEIKKLGKGVIDERTMESALEQAYKDKTCFFCGGTVAMATRTDYQTGEIDGYELSCMTCHQVYDED